MFFSLLITFIQIIVLVVLILISVAYFTLAERKYLAVIQRRRGPNVVGVYGLLQPLSDGLKLLLHELLIPHTANKKLFLFAPLLTFTVSLMSWAVIPFDKYAVISELNIGILYILAVSSVGVYGIIMSGWASNSKYAFLGSLRSTAQMVSYEISMGFIILTIAVCCESFSMNEIINFQRHIWFIFPFFPLGIIFFVSGLAETNRHPFDLPEAEAELVSGYNVEYSAMTFALFSLGEYSNMLIMSALNSILFFGGWLPLFKSLSFIPGSVWFGLKISFFVILYIIARAILPRYRYDQLMYLGWKVFLPISIGYLVLSFSVLYSSNYVY